MKSLFFSAIFAFSALNIQAQTTKATLVADHQATLKNTPTAQKTATQVYDHDHTAKVEEHKEK